jgi:hypothetical protein
MPVIAVTRRQLHHAPGRDLRRLGQWWFGLAENHPGIQPRAGMMLARTGGPGRNSEPGIRCTRVSIARGCLLGKPRRIEQNLALRSDIGSERPALPYAVQISRGGQGHTF